MASPGSPASSSSVSSNSSRTDHHSRPQTLEDLVHHFVASKRALNTQTVLWRANDIVTSARELLEENAILSAKNAAVRAIIDDQVDALHAVRRGMNIVETDIHAEFERVLHQVDTSFSGLQATFAVLRDTPIEAVLQPPDTPQKHLFDFIDSATVTNLEDSLRDCIDRHNDALKSLNASSDTFEVALESLYSSIESVPAAPTTASTPSPIPSLYYDLEGHAKEAAQAFQSLVSHYDLCVTALRHTEGGSDAATQATGDAPQSSGDDFSGPPEPVSEDERQHMLSVLQKDALEVEEVVSEIRQGASEMTFLLSQIENHITHLRNEDSALNSVLRSISHVAADVKSHIATSRSFHALWLEDTKPTLLSGVEEWENQREFYERFDLAYAELLVEVASRRRRHEKAKRKAEEAQKELDKLHADDTRMREQFAHAQGDFLPVDIWPGLRHAPRRYEVRVAMFEDDEDGAETGVQSIPQLERTIVERALVRVKRR